MKRKQQGQKLPINKFCKDLSKINPYHIEWTNKGFVFCKGHSGIWRRKDSSHTFRLVYQKGHGKNKEERVLSFRCAIRENSLKFFYYHVTEEINWL